MERPSDFTICGGVHAVGVCDGRYRDNRDWGVDHDNCPVDPDAYK